MGGQETCVRLVVVGFIVGLILAAQAPSQEEQQYLFSVLPLIDHGELAHAQQQLIAGIERFPRSAILFNALGVVYRREGKLEEAAEEFRKAIQILPQFTAALLQLASLDQQDGKKKEAAELFGAAGESTTNFDALMAAGLGLADCEDYPNAARVLAKALSIHPDSATAIYNLALAQYKAGDLASALNTAASITSEPGADVLYLRGKIKQALGRADGREDLAGACRSDPGNETFCTDAALAEIRQERFLEALDLLQPALKKSFRSDALLPLVALSEFRLGRYQEAIQTYRQALGNKSTLDASREGLGFLYYVTGDLEQARAVVEEGLKNPHADFYLAYLDAIILYRLSPQLRAQTRQAIERAIAANPSFAPSYFLRGKIEMENKETTAALADFEHAVSLAPHYPLPYYKMAQIYARQGRTREAETAQRKFMELGSRREEEVLARQTEDVLMPAQR